MLRNGKFIKEDPVKIGCYYLPFYRQQTTREGDFIQNILLTPIPNRSKSNVMARIAEIGVFSFLVLCGTMLFTGILKFIIDVSTNEK